MSDTTEAMDKAAGYVKQMIDTLTPIAKKGYEAGLATVQIDGAQYLIFSFGVLLLCIIFFKFAFKNYVENDKECIEMSPFFVVGAPFAAVAFVPAFLAFINIWNWVQLFKPELYLVHKAIEKVIS